MMQAHEVMTRDVVTIGGQDSVRHAAELMAERQVTSLPVLDEDERVIGIVSEADLIRDRMPSDPRSHLRPDDRVRPDPSRLVREVMTETVMCLAASADTADLAALMLDNNVRAVPIVDGAHLVGIVSRRDLLRTLLRPDAAIVHDVTERLDDYSGDSGRWKVAVSDGVVSITGRFADPDQERIVTALVRTVPGVLRVHTGCHHLR
jgi:CBS domain-containing protein